MRSPSPSLRRPPEAPRPMSPPLLRQSYSNPVSLLTHGGGGGGGDAGSVSGEGGDSGNINMNDASSVISSTTSNTIHIPVKGASGGSAASSRLHEKVSRSRKLRAIVTAAAAASSSSSSPAAAATTVTSRQTTPAVSNANRGANSSDNPNKSTSAAPTAAAALHNPVPATTTPYVNKEASSSSTSSSLTLLFQQHQPSPCGTLGGSSSSSVSSATKNNNKRESLSDKRRRAMARVGRLSTTSANSTTATPAANHPPVVVSSTGSTSPPSVMAPQQADHRDNNSAFLSSSSSTLSSSHNEKLTPQQQEQSPPSTQAGSSRNSVGSVPKVMDSSTISVRSKHAAQRLKFKKQKSQQQPTLTVAASSSNSKEENNEDNAVGSIVAASKSADSSTSCTRSLTAAENAQHKKDTSKETAEIKKSTAKQSAVVKENEHEEPAAPALLVAASRNIEQPKKTTAPPPMTTTPSAAKCVVTTIAKDHAAASVVCLTSWLKTKNNKASQVDAGSSQLSSSLVTTSTTTKQEEEEPPKLATRPVVTAPCKGWRPPPLKQRSSSEPEEEEEEEKKQQAEDDPNHTAPAATMMPGSSRRSWMPTPQQQQQRALAEEKELARQKTEQEPGSDNTTLVSAEANNNTESKRPAVVVPPTAAQKQHQQPPQQQQQPSRNKKDPPAICFPADYYYSRAKNKLSGSSSIGASVKSDVGAAKTSSNNAAGLSPKPKLRLAASPSSRSAREREVHGGSIGDTSTRREEQQPSASSSSSSLRYASPSIRRDSSHVQQQLTPELHHKVLEARRKAASSPAPPPHPRQSPCTVPPETASATSNQPNVRKSSSSSSELRVSSSHHLQQSFGGQEHALKKVEKKKEVVSEKIVKELQTAETTKAGSEEAGVPRSRNDVENGATATSKQKKKVVEWPMPLVAGATAGAADDLLVATGSKSISTEQATFEDADNYSYTDSLFLDTFKGKGQNGNNNLVKSVMERRKDLGKRDERNTQRVEAANNKGRCWSPPPIPSASMSADTASAAESEGPPTISEASSVRDERAEARRCLTPPPYPTFNKTAGGKAYAPNSNKNNIGAEQRQCLSPPRPSMSRFTGAESSVESPNPVPLPPAPPNSVVKGQRSWVSPHPRGGAADAAVRGPAVYSAQGEHFEPPQLRSLRGTDSAAANHPQGQQPKQGVAERFRRDVPMLGSDAIAENAAPQSSIDAIVDSVAQQSNIEQPEKVCVSSMKARFNQAPGNGVVAPKVLEKQENFASEAIQEIPVTMRTSLPLGAGSDPYRRSGLDRRSYSPCFLLDESPAIETSHNSTSLRSADYRQTRAGASRNAMDKQATDSDDDCGYIPRIRPGSGGGSSIVNNGLSTRPADRVNVGKKFDSTTSDHGSDSVIRMKPRYASSYDDPRRSPPLNVMQRSKLLERKPLDEEPMLQQSHEEPVLGMPNAVIETPAKVNVASMAGMFNQTPGSKSRKTTGSAGKSRSSLAMRSPSPGRRWGSPSPVRSNEAGPKTPSWVKKVNTSEEVAGTALPMSPSAVKHQTSPVGRSLRSGSNESFSPKGTKSPVPLASSPRGHAANSNAHSPRNRRRDLQLPNIDEIPAKRAQGGTSVMPPTSPRARLANNKAKVLHIWDKAAPNNRAAAAIRSSSPLRTHDGPVGVQSTRNMSQVPTPAIAPRMSSRTESSSKVFVDGVSATIPEMPSAESFDCASGGDHLEQNIKSTTLEVKSPSQAERISNREMKGDSHAESELYADSTITQTAAFQATQHDAADHGISQPEQKVDVRKVIAGDSRPPAAAISPTSPSHITEKPWQKDLRTLPPHSWQKYVIEAVENEMTKVKDHLKKHRESDENSRTSTPHTQNLTPYTSAKKNELVFESDSYGEEKKSNKGDDALLPSRPNSLKRLAADSVHAVDYDRAIQGMMSKSTTQSSSMEIDEYSSGSRGAIPKELPPEFAHALASQGAATAPPNPALGKEDKSESESEPEIVFGDPLTYGAAGGEAEKSPPTVSDRAKAIAAWKGGLGVKAKNKESDSQKSRTSSQSQVAAFLDDSQSVGARLERVPASIGGRRGGSPTKSVESRDSKAAAATAGHQASRGASAVLRFWASTSKDEVADAQEWKDRDPDVGDYGTDIPESPFDSSKLANKLVKNVTAGGDGTKVPDDGFTIERATDDAFDGFHSTKDSGMDDMFGEFGATKNSSDGRVVAGAASAEREKISGWGDVDTGSLPEMGLAPFSLESTAIAFNNTTIPKDEVNMFDPFSIEPDIHDFGRADDFFTGNLDKDGFGSTPFPTFATDGKQTMSGIPDDGFNTSSFPSFDTGTRRAAAGKPNGAVQKLEEALNAIAPSQDFDDENSKPDPSSFITTENDGFDQFDFPTGSTTGSGSRMAMQPRHDAAGGGIWSFEASKKGGTPRRYDAIASTLQKDSTAEQPRSEI